MESRSVDQNKLNELMKKGWSWRSSSGGGSGNSGGSVSIDATLTKSGAAADAKATGDEINALTEEIVKSINGLKPDENGNITLPIYNGEVADA